MPDGRRKMSARRALRQKSTATAVPALAVLLTDKELSHAGGTPGPFAEAGQALRDALAKTEVR